VGSNSGPAVGQSPRSLISPLPAEPAILNLAANTMMCCEPASSCMEGKEALEHRAPHGPR
jgi:hypothetical protein